MSRDAAAPREPARLGARLDALCEGADVAATLAGDPLSFPRRYARPADAEVAALFASALAFGRVRLFWPVLVELFRAADAAGGPYAWVHDFGPKDAASIAPLVYRWNRGPDLALLARAARRVLRACGRLGVPFEAAFSPTQPNVGPSLEAGIGALRRYALDEAGALGLAAASWEDLPRSFRTLLPVPSEGSACKRWNMLLRWLVRRPGPTDAAGLPLRVDGADLGLWDLPASHLIVPLDVHVARISRLIGLTTRRDDGWRTAVEITGVLAQLDPGDPVRYDFALAHLGISAGCRARWIPETCGPCPLRPICREAEG